MDINVKKNPKNQIKNITINWTNDITIDLKGKKVLFFVVSYSVKILFFFS